MDKILSSIDSHSYIHPLFMIIFWVFPAIRFSVINKFQKHSFDKFQRSNISLFRSHYTKKNTATFNKWKNTTYPSFPSKKKFKIYRRPRVRSQSRSRKGQSRSANRPWSRPICSAPRDAIAHSTSQPGSSSRRLIGRLAIRSARLLQSPPLCVI